MEWEGDSVRSASTAFVDHRAQLFSTVLLPHSTAQRITLQIRSGKSITVQYNIEQDNIVQWEHSIEQHKIVQCSTVQYSTVQYSTVYFASDKYTS